MASEDSDTITDHPVPKRPVALNSALRGDISWRFWCSAIQAEVPRFSSGDALEPVALFGMDIDPALLRDPVFSKRHDLGRHPDGAFVRGHSDPATRHGWGETSPQ